MNDIRLTLVGGRIAGHLAAESPIFTVLETAD